MTARLLKIAAALGIITTGLFYIWPEQQGSLIPDINALYPPIAKVCDRGVRVAAENATKLCHAVRDASDRVESVWFDKKELQKYLNKEKSIYHNVDMTPITKQFVRHLSRILPKKDMQGFQKCAIVFSSGSLLGQASGKVIDTYDEVIRFNWAPTIGYEKYVGSKTTILVGALHITNNRNLEHRLPLRYYDRSNLTMLVGATRHYDLRDLVFGEECLTRCGDRPDASSWVLRFPSDDIQQLANRILCAATDEGTIWAGNDSEHVPSSGLIATLTMIHLCKQVDLFGATFAEGIDNYHYWETGTEWPETTHWFSLEHALYQWWHSMGYLRILYFI